MATPTLSPRIAQLASANAAATAEAKAPKLPPKKKAPGATQAAPKPQPEPEPAPAPEEDDDADEEGEGEEAKGSGKGRRKIDDAYEAAVNKVKNGRARASGRKIAKAQRLLAKAQEMFDATLAEHADKPEVDASAAALRTAHEALAEVVEIYASIPRMGASAAPKVKLEVGMSVVVKSDKVETYAAFGVKEGIIGTVTKHLGANLFEIDFGGKLKPMIIREHLVISEG